MDALGLEAALDRVLAAGVTPGTRLAGVDGPGGAGKSTFAAALASALESRGVRAGIVPMDDFYRPAAGRPAPGEGPPGGAFDWVRLRDEVLLPLRGERPARYAPYDWGRDAPGEPREIAPGGVVIVEGVTSCRSELTALFDLRIWVECPREVRLARGLARDGEAARGRWVGEWMPEEDRYFGAHRPRDSAHVIVNGNAAG